MNAPLSNDPLIAGVLRSDAGFVARLMRAVEDGAPGARAYLGALRAHTGRARVVGITGAPGAGKSTLVDQLVGAWRARGLRVGVLAVDPSSPLHGGALLGDRIRMMRHAGDPGTLVRSMASRGQRGGLALRTADLVDILDAAGTDVVVVETVGVGQDGVDIMELADRTILVQAPGQGDEVQAMKAGILEIASILVVNKCDLDGADRLERDLRAAQALTPGEPGQPPQQILRTQALSGEGVEALAAAILDSGIRPSCAQDRQERARCRLDYRMAGRARELVLARLDGWLASDSEAAALRAELHAGRIDLEMAAERAVNVLLGETPPHTAKEQEL